MKKEQILKCNNIQIERLKQEKPMLVHNILKAMDDYAELSERQETSDTEIQDKNKVLNIAVMHRLKAVQTLKNSPDLLLLMAEFKRANFVGSYIVEHQIESEEELAAVWLSELEAQLFRSNGA